MAKSREVIKTKWKDGTTRRIEYIKEGTDTVKHRDEDLPAVTEWWRNGNLRYVAYFQEGKLYRPEGWAVRHFYKNGQVEIEAYYQKKGATKHREGDLPAFTYWDEDGELLQESYHLNGNNFRESYGPSMIDYHKGKITRMCFYDTNLSPVSFWEAYDLASEEVKDNLITNWLPHFR